MENVSFDALSFGAFLNTPQCFVLDLSKHSVMELIEEHIKFKIPVSPNFGQNYHMLKKCIRGLEFRFGVKLMPIQITDVFWNHFISYLDEIMHLQPDSCCTMICQLRSTLSWAAKHNCPVAETFDCITLPKCGKEMVALTPDEVSHICHFDCNTLPMRRDARKNMELVRDSFVLCCNLGQRHSDMRRINKSCFNKNIFKIVQQKTGNKAVLDIEKMAIDKKTTYRLLDKYNYQIPYKAGTRRFDFMLHKLIKYIGQEFDETFRQETKFLGRIRTTDKSKWQLITSHTARRTFVTVNVLRGYPEYEIRRSTGHSDPRSLKGYICLDE